MKTQELLASLSVDRWTQIVYAQPYVWTVRDLVAHFFSAEQHLLALAQDVAAGGLGAPLGLDYDAFNAEEQERLKDRSPQELLPALAQARQATVAWVRTLDDRQLDRVGRHPALGEIPLETMLTAMYGHQLLHMRDLRSKLV